MSSQPEIPVPQNPSEIAESDINAVWINVETQGEVTTIKIEHHQDDGSIKKEEIQVKKEGQLLKLVRKQESDEITFDLTNPAIVNCMVQGIHLDFKQNGELCLSGEYPGVLLVEYPGGKVTINKEQKLKVYQNFFIKGANLFENAGSLEVGKDCLCLLSSIKNMGQITIKEGWQVFVLQTFENSASGKMVMQQADIMSPTRITNHGQITCVLKFNGATCDFINHAGEVLVGGDTTLKSLTDKSETEPAINGTFTETERILQDAHGVQIQKGDGRIFLLNQSSCWCDPKGNPNPDYYSESFRSGCIGCKRIVTSEQKFTRREGKKSLFIVHGCLHLKQPSQIICGYVSASGFEGNMSLKGFATFKQIATFTFRCTDQQYFEGNFFGGGGRTVYSDSFVQSGTQTVLNELVPSVMEVVGNVTGKIETYINGKADKAQPGVVKVTGKALDKWKEKLNAASTEADIFPMMVNPEEYERDLKKLMEDPVFARMVYVQQQRRGRSQASSELPSRQASPGAQ